MGNLDNQSSSSRLISSGDAEAIEHLKQAIASGVHWYTALLEAMGLWSSAEETCDGRVYRYLIAGEAFDWLLLAERLCSVVDGLLPDGEKTALLIYGNPPIDITNEGFKELIGHVKYHQYLNYFYGVTVEQSLILTVQEEVRKEQGIWGCNGEDSILDEVYCRIYGGTQAALLKHFRREKGYRQLRSISLAEMSEFTYWLFKYRLENCDKAKIASDTKKGLDRLMQGGPVKGRLQ
ncbi:hypothetical protein ACFLRP_01720 [Bacteroidota bacterium]